MAIYTPLLDINSGESSQALKITLRNQLTPISISRALATNFFLNDQSESTVMKICENSSAA